MELFQYRRHHSLLDQPVRICQNNHSSPSRTVSQITRYNRTQKFTNWCFARWCFFWLQGHVQLLVSLGVIEQWQNETRFCIKLLRMQLVPVQGPNEKNEFPSVQNRNVMKIMGIYIYTRAYCWWLTTLFRTWFNGHIVTYFISDQWLYLFQLVSRFFSIKSVFPKLPFGNYKLI